MRKVIHIVKSKGLQVHLSRGSQVAIVGVVGDRTRSQGSNIEINGGMDKVVAVTESYRLVGRKFHPEDSIVPVGDTHIGPRTVATMAGPCAIESKEQLMETAFVVKKAGVAFLRGGAYKPRTSPYSLQGLGEGGPKYMKEAREATGLSVICEVISLHAIETAPRYVDMLQIGAGNVQNLKLLREVGKPGIPVLLKRGLCATIDGWLNTTRCIIPEGNPNIILCKRGIHAYETSTRNTLDVSAVPVIRRKSHLPITADPSHATGVRAYVEPLAKASVVVGIDGLMIEIHPRPSKALSDGPRSLTSPAFEQLIADLKPYADLVGRTFEAE